MQERAGDNRPSDVKWTVQFSLMPSYEILIDGGEQNIRDANWVQSFGDPKHYHGTNARMLIKAHKRAGPILATH